MKLLVLVLPDLVRLYLYSGQRMMAVVDKYLVLGCVSETVERGCMGFDYTAHIDALHNLDSNLKVVPGHMSRNFAVVVEEKNYVVRNIFFCHANNCLVSSVEAGLCRESDLTTPDTLSKWDLQPVLHLPIKCQERQS